MALHKGNKHTLRDSVNHLASLGLKTLKAVMVNNSGEWKKNDLAGMSLSISEFFQTCLDYLPCYYSDGMPVNLLLTSFFRASPKSPDEYHIIGYDECYDPDKTFLCGAIRHITYISPEGRILMCSSLLGTNLERDCDSITSTSTSTGKKLSECLRAKHYRNFVNLTARDILNTNSECRNCKFSKHCSGGCRMIPLLLLGENHIMGKSPTLCELHYGDWVNKIIDTVNKARPSAKLHSTL